MKAFSGPNVLRDLVCGDGAAQTSACWSEAGYTGLGRGVGA